MIIPVKGDNKGMGIPTNNDKHQDLHISTYQDCQTMDDAELHKQ